jgi:hypothetical protein
MIGVFVARIHQVRMAARPQVTVYNLEGAASGEVPLPAVLTVSLEHWYDVADDHGEE